MIRERDRGYRREMADKKANRTSTTGRKQTPRYRYDAELSAELAAIDAEIAAEIEAYVGSR